MCRLMGTFIDPLKEKEIEDKRSKLGFLLHRDNLKAGQDAEEGCLTVVGSDNVVGEIQSAVAEDHLDLHGEGAGDLEEPQNADLFWGELQIIPCLEKSVAEQHNGGKEVGSNGL